MTQIKYDKHNHVSKYAAGLILSGNVQITERDCTTEMVEDDMFIIPIYCVHALYSEDVSARVLTMCIEDEFLKNHLIEQGQQILRNMMQPFREKKLISDNQESAYLDAYEIINSMYLEQEELPETVGNVTELMQKEPEKDWKLDELAASVYINKYHMIRKFKETIGLTPHYFHIQNRIRKAQKLLRDGHSVADTAVEMGFYDQSHFDKTFHSIMGISPREYLKSLEDISLKRCKKAK